MSDRLLIEGLRLEGHHGALAGEQERAQPFLIDLEIRFDMGPAAATDALEDTVDVRDLIRCARAVVEGPSCRLMERLADQVAAALLEDPRILGVRVRITKEEAPFGEGAPLPYAVEVDRGLGQDG